MNSIAFADTPQDNGIENYTFIESPENAKEIPNRENISVVTLYSDSMDRCYLLELKKCLVIVILFT